MNSFAQLALTPPLAQALAGLGFVTMTPVQEHALPPLLAGRDVIAQARTGSGKTVAFGLALLSRLAVESAQVQALVLCPTRELAEQVGAELRRLARLLPNLRVVTLCGGVPVRTQIPSLQTTPQVVVGTPGRILDHCRRGSLALGELRVLVLDEADRMLDMGFIDEITAIVAQTPAARQSLLFSATFPAEIRALSRRLQREPVTVTVDTQVQDAELTQVFYEVAAADKLAALLALLAEQRPESALVFCHTRSDAQQLAQELDRCGFAALALHGELTQREREEVLLRFAHKSLSVLVATDVAARGLDIKGLPLVISWELPVTPDVHLHRIGRTGRAGQRGLALSLCAPAERERAAAILARPGTTAQWARLPAAPATLSIDPPPMVTLFIEGGRQDKLRPGDLLGALTGEVGLPAAAVGRIDILPTRSYLAIVRAHAEAALHGLRAHKVKGKTFRVGRLDRHAGAHGQGRARPQRSWYSS
jgi:ATP-independent RNA helicase DbpA